MPPFRFPANFAKRVIQIGQVGRVFAAQEFSCVQPHPEPGGWAESETV
jgi:hypothetical protein